MKKTTKKLIELAAQRRGYHPKDRISDARVSNRDYLAEAFRKDTKLSRDLMLGRWKPVDKPCIV
jgi:hypothetical protein